MITEVRSLMQVGGEARDAEVQQSPSAEVSSPFANCKSRFRNSALRKIVPLKCNPRVPSAPNPKFVQNLSQTIVFGGSSQGDQKFVKKLSKICKTDNFQTNFQIFDKFFSDFWSPWLEPPKTIARDRFWTNLGFGVFLNAVRGKSVRKISCSKSSDLIAFTICDSNRESEITSDLRECELTEKSSML